ncbi:hypothetical protein C4B63_25g287 [Trypanosoma cruzi]|uniref:Uncharacterized protein n=1 Tax=Trypanosoma cruzi TaxID=5693 RepID=A0A2V2VJT7_TRYCR|nr:hypothetical protein C4B63_25g287 [Trypanosoma cruzi]
MMTSVAKSLHCLGRYDVGLLRNDDSTAFTLIQSPPFNEAVVTDETQSVEQCRRAIQEAKIRIERADTRSKARFFDAARAGTKPKEQPGRVPSTCVRKEAKAKPATFRKTSYEQIQEMLRAYQASRVVEDEVHQRVLEFREMRHQRGTGTFCGGTVGIIPRRITTHTIVYTA